ncbi:MULTISPECIES: DoxX family protein [Pacificibacter]|uniref:DoxX family protein n=1 Tax=Pacificibacter TaxID=1042323 RepID=UPI001C080170|nr:MULTISPECIES: DoxX family protein [Pacificibacter]MBU2935846.1 DoxX family protein [Pacificibacter marinus]MDO6614341.1 DoxX family protein [Pacificibacter sp. 1_MG-2023]
MFERFETALSRLNAFTAANLPLLARVIFAAVLARYFWASAITKLDGVFTPALGAYAQIFPRQLEAAGYDTSGFGAFHWVIIMAGTYAEFVLPALLIIGLATRPAAFAMAGFIVVQSLTDIIGHHADPATIGMWFDRASDALILDQRAYWMLGLLTLIGLGAGPLSVDSLLKKRLSKPS